MVKLYFCDGHACDDEKKVCCYMNNGTCNHTSDIMHSLSRHTPDFPPTKFVPLKAAGDADVETFDTTGIFKQLSNGSTLKLVKS